MLPHRERGRDIFEELLHCNALLRVTLVLSPEGVASTWWRSVMGCHNFIGPFPQKSPVIIGCFAQRDLQFKASYASSPPCNTRPRCVFVGKKGEGRREV